jgi:hypothetical protein
MGAHLGASGLVVVEWDTPEAGEKLTELLAGELPTTPIVQARRGFHLYFPDPGGLRKCSKDGLELRVANHICALPPSVHPDSGRPYEWLHEKLTPWTCELVELPSAIVDYFGTAKRNGRAAKPVAEIIPTGQRHDSLLSLAGSMRRRGMSERSIRAALEATNGEKCRPPLPDTEVAELARDITERYAPAEQLGVEPYDGPARSLAEVVVTFRKWLHLPMPERSTSRSPA